MDKKLKILYVAGVSPYNFANMIYDSIIALQCAGHDVDFITTFSFKRQKRNMYAVYNNGFIFKIARRIYLSSLKRKIVRKNGFIEKKLHIRQSRPMKNGCMLAHDNDRIPPIPMKLFFNKLSEHYDLIITAVWDSIISAETLRQLHEHYKAPIIIQPADMYPLTGGCEYPGNCTNYYHGCGNCHIIDSRTPNDQTHRNFLYKKEVYSSINCALLTNSYMINQAMKCGLFDNALIKKKYFTLNGDVYKPMDWKECRHDLGIPPNKRFVIFSRYSDPDKYPRKGIHELVSTINLFCELKSQEELSKMCLVFAGTRCSDSIREMIPVDVIDVGLLSSDLLIKAYSASSVFVSPSIRDAGPSMVNQSIMCGTPVVCFNIGAAIDVIFHKKNGYKAPIADVKELSDGLDYIYNLNDSEYTKMREQTRKIAMELQSFDSYANIVNEVYKELSC